MSWTEIESMIKSCVVSKKGDMTLHDLKVEYFELVGKDIPFRTFGCDSLEAFLHKISGVYLSQNARGDTIITANSQKAAHIADLVRKQKFDQKALKKRNKISYSPKKRFWTAKRNASSRPFQSLNGNMSRTRASPANLKWPRANGYSGVPSGSDYSFNSRVSCTQVRYIPAGEELSEDSDGYSPDRGEKKETLTLNGNSRTVTICGNTLRCTVTDSPSRDAICSSVNIKVEDTNNYSSWDNGPVLLGYHLVGDDFLLQFAYECLHSEYVWDDSERLTCGMCISGQTIHDFHNQVLHEGVIQPKIMLMLGAVDILQNRSLRCIIDDMTDLLEELLNSGVETVILLTIPFLKNAGLSNRKVLVFNEFLKTLDEGATVQVLDVHPLFNSYYRNQTYDNCMNPKCYELSARDVLCYPNGVVLWSHIGRSYVYNFLLQQLTDLENKY